MNLQNLPRFVIILGVFAIGVVFFVLIQKPHTKCDSQVELLRKSEAGWIFSKDNKGITHPSLYIKTLENCKLGMASLGACFEYFRVLRHFVTDLQNISMECGPDLMEIPEAKNALVEGLRMMVQMAWGENPPAKGSPVGGKLESPDLALFCALKENLLRYAGPEVWESLKNSTYLKLPGEERKFESGSGHRTLCLNCDNLPNAVKAMGGVEEVFPRSLFALRCDLYR